MPFMDKTMKIKKVILSLILTPVFFACGNTATPEQIREWIAKGSLVIDARTPREFQAGNYPGSVNIPLQEIEGRLNEFGKKEGYIIVYCRSGNRSGKAVKILKSHGFLNVINGGSLQNMIKSLKFNN
jgi:rhodanese-related sulfurtransferase